MTNVWRLAENDLGFPPRCYYWGTYRPSNIGFAHCESYDESGECTRWVNNDGTPFNSEYGANGTTTHCVIFGEAILSHLKIIKTCKGNAYDNGCIPNDYVGLDKNIIENYTGDGEISAADVNKATTGTKGFRADNIKTKSAVYVLADGSMLITLDNSSSFTPKLFLVDINGKNGPNKWGYDVFDFKTVKNHENSITLQGGGYSTQKGGTKTQSMIDKIIKNQK